MIRSELVRLARELNTVHHIMPVPVAGKVPLGGKGWNRQSLEDRMRYFEAPECTGLGIQCGLIFHPVYGPVELRALDCDIDDFQKSMLFTGTLQNYFAISNWRWGRRPATLIFTNPGVIKTEKFGPIQLLGADKQVVYFGAYINKVPLQTDPSEYRHEGKSIFEQMPPFVPAEKLRQALQASLAIAGYSVIEKKHALDAVPLSTADLEMLNELAVARFRRELQSFLDDVDMSPIGSGRGTKLFNLGIKYGALIKASGNAPSLIDAAQEVPGYIEFDTTKKHAFLDDIGRIAEEAFDVLPGSLGQGDRRDLARGVALSMGLGQQIAVIQAKTHMPMPSGRGHPGQTAEDLLLKKLAPLRYLVPRYFTDSGCIVLAGKPKIGKGWIILELGICIAEGGTFWNQQCEQGEVLMYMLEDSDRRIQERLNTLRPFGFVNKGALRFRYSIDGPFYVNADGTGTLLDDIQEHIRCFPRIKLVVVDVFQRIRGDEKRTDNAYQSEFKIIGAIQKLAAKYNVLILVVHHTKKGRVDDAIDSINGSFGIAGGADGSLVIGKDGDVVCIESFMRDIANYKFDLIKEDGGPMWKPAQTAAELIEEFRTKKDDVLEALRKAACALKTGDIAIRTGISDNNVATYLMRLEKNSQVIRTSRGYYMAAGLPFRDRIEGVIDLLKRCQKIVATNEIKLQYGPEIAPPDANYMMFTDVAIKEIEANFVKGKDTLNSLKSRNLAKFNSDTLWLIGDKWEAGQPVMVPNPFAFKYPWE